MNVLTFAGKHFPVSAVECIETSTTGDAVRVVLTTIRGRTTSEDVTDQAAADARVAQLLQQCSGPVSATV